MTIHYQGHGVTLHHGDCLDVLRTLPDASVDSVVTDPPYGLEFMGKDWDAPWKAEGAHWREASRLPGSHSTNPTPRPQNFGTAGKPFQDWCEQWARECLRVLKPGGHMLAFGGTRTWHRLACAIEDSGFEVRDSIAWLHGQGFPKSLDVSKAIDKRRDWTALGDAEALARLTAEGLIRADQCVVHSVGPLDMGAGDLTLGLLEGAVTLVVTSRDGLRRDIPATDAAREWEGWGTALKPAFEPVVVARKPIVGTVAANVLAWGTGALNVDGCRIEGGGSTTAGRWPANVVLDETQAEALDEQSGPSQSRVGKPRGADSGEGWGMTATGAEYDDLGGASRFFYVAKADASERPRVNGTAHPTVKPLDLMRWLVRLVTPPGGTVLEPFAGSGTTVEACIIEGFQCIAIEREADYLPLIRQRIDRRRDPVEALRGQAADLGLFDLLGGESA